MRANRRARSGARAWTGVGVGAGVTEVFLTFWAWDARRMWGGGGGFCACSGAGLVRWHAGGATRFGETRPGGHRMCLEAPFVAVAGSISP